MQATLVGSHVHESATRSLSATGGAGASSQRPFIIGVAGGTASGKTSVCRSIINKLVVDGADCGRGVLSISQDCFYRDLTSSQRADIASYNFDHPDAFDFTMITRTLRALRAGDAVDIPIYDFVSSARREETTRVETTEVILFDGILALYEPEVRELLDLRIFVDAEADVRLARRLRRDIAERGRQVQQVPDQYERTVKPSFDSYVSPTKRHADIIIPRGAENVAAIELLWQNIRFRIQPPSSPAARDAGQVAAGVAP